MKSIYVGNLPFSAKEDEIRDLFAAYGEVQMVKFVMYPGVKLACIGPVTAKTLTRYGFRAHIQPEDYTIPALAEALGKEL